MTRNRTPDVIVVGGGVIGAASLYHLAKRGLRAMLLEGDHLASGASGATAGMISAAINPTGPIAPLARGGLAAIEQAVQDFEIEPEIQRGGSINTARSEKGAKRLEVAAEEARQSGVEVQYLEGPEVREREPLIAASILAASFNPGGFHLNPFLLCAGFVAAARRFGADARYGVKVHDVELNGNRIGKLVTNQGDFRCGWVVNSCGAHAPQILERAGVRIPIEPGRGQVIISERCRPLTPYMIHAPGHLYVRQTASGNFLLGSQTEMVGFDKSITLDRISNYTRELAKTVPLLGRLQAVRIYAGWRPMTPDNLPIIGPLPTCARMVMAAGHCRSGILYSAITGQLVSEWIVDQETHTPLEPFSISRFDQQEHQFGRSHER
jgi:sarcosine oxidase subunit beta